MCHMSKAINRYRSIAEKVISKYRKPDSIVGIIWVGSSSLGIEDEFSHIDIRLLSKSSQKTQPMEQIIEEGVTVQIDEMSWPWITQKADLTSEQYWLREKAIILFDPEQIVKNTFQKLNEESAKKFDSVLWRLYKKIYTLEDIKKCIARREYIAASMYFYKTVDAFTQFIFVYHKQAVPTFKWRWYFLKQEKLFDIEKLKVILQTENAIDESYAAIEELQKKARGMMLAKGYEKEKVTAPWKF